MIVLVSVRDNELDITYNLGYVESAEKDDFQVAKEAAENRLKHAQMSDESFGEIIVRKNRVSYAATTPSHNHTLILSLLPNLNTASIGI